MSYIIGAAQFDVATRINALMVPLFAPLAPGLDRVPGLPPGFKQKFKTRPVDALLDLAAPVESIIYDVNNRIVTKVNGGKIPFPGGAIDLNAFQPDDNNLDESDRDFVRRVRGILIFMSCMVFIPEIFQPVLDFVVAKHAADAVRGKLPSLPPLPSLPGVPQFKNPFKMHGVGSFSIGLTGAEETSIALAAIGGTATVSSAALPPATIAVSKGISDVTAARRASGGSGVQSENKSGAGITIVNAVKEMKTGEKVAVGVGILSAVGITAYLLKR